MSEKPWYTSKTLIFNVGCAALMTLEASTGLLQPLLSVNLYTSIAVTLPVVNAMLRVITTSGVKL